MGTGPRFRPLGPRLPCVHRGLRGDALWAFRSPEGLFTPLTRLVLAPREAPQGGTPLASPSGVRRGRPQACLVENQTGVARQGCVSRCPLWQGLGLWHIVPGGPGSRADVVQAFGSSGKLEPDGLGAGRGGRRAGPGFEGLASRPQGGTVQAGFPVLTCTLHAGVAAFQRPPRPGWGCCVGCVTLLCSRTSLSSPCLWEDGTLAP